jgi:hypothetical protein
MVGGNYNSNDGVPYKGPEILVRLGELLQKSIDVQGPIYRKENKSIRHTLDTGGERLDAVLKDVGLSREEAENIISSNKGSLSSLRRAIRVSIPKLRAVYDPDTPSHKIPVGSGFARLHGIPHLCPDEYKEEVAALIEEIRRYADERFEPYRNDEIIAFNEGVTQLVQPFLGRKEYGNLKGGSGGFPNGEDDEEITWALNYELTPSGSTSGIFVHYIIDDGHFQYLVGPKGRRIWNAGDSGENAAELYRVFFESEKEPRHRKTKDPKRALRHVEIRLGNMRAERLACLMTNAELNKKRNVPKEKAIEAMRELGETNPWGTTEEELAIYRRFCEEVYSQ